MDDRSALRVGEVRGVGRSRCGLIYMYLRVKDWQTQKKIKIKI